MYLLGIIIFYDYDLLLGVDELVEPPLSFQPVFHMHINTACNTRGNETLYCYRYKILMQYSKCKTKQKKKEFCPRGNITIGRRASTARGGEGAGGRFHAEVL